MKIIFHVLAILVTVKLSCCDETTYEEWTHNLMSIMQCLIVEGGLRKLLDNDGTKTCKDEPMAWVTPILVVPKPKVPNKVQIYVDMWGLNNIIKCERQLLQRWITLSQNWTERQCFLCQILLLIPPGITDSWVSWINYLAPISDQCKRMKSRVDSATDFFQHKIWSVLRGLRGVIHISDNIPIHGKQTIRPWWRSWGLSSLEEA